MKYFLPLILLIAVSLGSCDKKRLAKQAEEDEKIIQDYIAANNLSTTAVATGSGLYYTIDEAGSGESCNATSKVRVKYKGYFTNGSVFDQSPEEGLSFPLQNVIKGWTEGIPYYKEGGKGVLLIPSALGYGGVARGSIPKFSVLIFDVELLEVIE